MVQLVRLPTDKWGKLSRKARGLGLEPIALARIWAGKVAESATGSEHEKQVILLITDPQLADPQLADPRQHLVFTKYKRDWLHQVTGYSKAYLSRVATGRAPLTRSFIERVCSSLKRPERELFLLK